MPPALYYLHMKNLLFGLTLFIAPLALPLAAELTPAEQTVRDACVANISDKVYSPIEANNCLDGLHADNDKLYNKLKTEENEKPEWAQTGTLTYILKNENLFKELGEFFDDKPSKCRLRQRYVALLEDDAEQSGCVLCELDMGPQPDKTFPWIRKYYGGALPDAQKAGLSWGEVAAPRQATLAKIGCSQARWNDLKLSERTAVLMADDSLFTSGLFAKEIAPCRTTGSNPQLYLQNYIPYDIRESIQKFLATIAPAGAKPGEQPKPGPDASKYSAAAVKAAAMAGKPDADVMSYLGGVFDKSVSQGALHEPAIALKPKGTAAKEDPNKYKLPEDKWETVASELKVRMLGGKSSLDNKPREAAFSGTPLEDELRAHYTAKDKDGKPLHDMKLQIRDIGGSNGAYCPQHVAECSPGFKGGDIAISNRLAEEWMKKNNCTAERLLSDPAMMDKLSRSLYPVTLHEGIHNVHQDEFYIANGVPNKKMADKEVVAFSGQALGIKAKLADPKTRKLYEGEMSEFDMEVLGELENGNYRGMKKFIRYYNLEGTQGASAKSFSQMEAALKEINLRKTTPGYNSDVPDSEDCSWYTTQSCSTAQLTDMAKKAYPWYETVIPRQRSDIEMINKEIARLNALDTSSRWKKIQATKVEALKGAEATAD